MRKRNVGKEKEIDDNRGEERDEIIRISKMMDQRDSIEVIPILMEVRNL
ncbi:hypothetical protein HNR77_000876 [Paenibacillus sp. JGP012]|nr:hypothetical protein [Paenibacillus sp. JGP012]